MFRAIANSVCDTRDFLSGHSPNQKTEKACHKDLPAATLWQAGTKGSQSFFRIRFLGILFYNGVHDFKEHFLGESLVPLCLCGYSLFFVFGNLQFLMLDKKALCV